MIRQELVSQIEQQLKVTVIQTDQSNPEGSNPIITLSRPEMTGNDGNKNVLDLEDMEKKLSYHCRDGFCGNCQCRLIKGAVAQENGVLAVVREGNFLACKSRILSKAIQFESNTDFRK